MASLNAFVFRRTIGSVCQPDKVLTKFLHNKVFTNRVFRNKSLQKKSSIHYIIKWQQIQCVGTKSLPKKTLVVGANRARLEKAQRAGIQLSDRYRHHGGLTKNPHENT